MPACDEDLSYMFLELAYLVRDGVRDDTEVSRHA